MVESKDPSELIAEEGNRKRRLTNDAKTALQWFLDRQAQMFDRTDAASEISKVLNSDVAWADECISQLVGDIVDPVQQVTTPDGRFVGVVEFSKYSDAGAYGYSHVDDNAGKLKRVVCARCVEQADFDSEVAHATEGQGSISANCSWSDLKSEINKHYTQYHNANPENIDVGASLLSGTTISGNTSWHNGNVSANDGLSVGSASVGLSGGALGRIQEVTFNNIEDLSQVRAIGIDDSEGPMYKSSGGTTYPLWNSNRVNAGNNISISGGTGPGSTPITISATSGSSPDFKAETITKDVPDSEIVSFFFSGNVYGVGGDDISSGLDGISFDNPFRLKVVDIQGNEVRIAGGDGNRTATVRAVVKV